MRYWDDDQADWEADERAFAEAWRGNSKWVVSRSLTLVGPNATLLGGDLEAAVRALKSDVGGEIEVGGPVLARSLTALGLIDEYRIYLHPVVLGGGALLRRPPAAAAAGGERPDRRGRGAAGLRAGVSGRGRGRPPQPNTSASRAAIWVQERLSARSS